jgi:hypothetical protein
MTGGRCSSWRRWLARVRHPAGHDGLLASAGLVLPLVVAGALILTGHHLDTGAIAIFATVCVGLPVVWLTWAMYRDANESRVQAAHTQPETTSTSSDLEGPAVGQVVVHQPPVDGPQLRLAPRPAVLVGRGETARRPTYAADWR